MPPDILNKRDFTPEMVFSASRSSGPGGQNVNKVSTKVELRFNVVNSTLLTQDEKTLVMKKLGTRINQEGELVLVSQRERTQLKNKHSVIAKFNELLIKALTPRKKRKPTKPSAEVKEKRLEEKRNLAEKKEARKKPGELSSF
ncbi:MAG: alternative ribosome rescue aminoacyl-tRNA hydrolase ArfB [Bacteroidetes bacterium]|nr:alternative ribosome rescue aminoacyl-tRNA hydrolase ArfB [Bacteroidota bacterium]